ncbi:MAG: hypothetical protein KGL03_09770 [Nitrospirota bacterium]|nr:hypothetical protein [Nitrospirota bacterium]MDE3224046.1 hypothetical protein [Nitrospirota bacterium]
MTFLPFRSVALAGLLSLAGFCVEATSAMAYDSGWLDKVTQQVLMEQSLAKEGSFAPYLEQIRLVQDAVDKGDAVGTYRSMNRLMVLLETGAGGIPRRTAEKIWAYCYEVVPQDLHSDEVHIKAMGRKEYDRMKEQEERERYISSHSF